jgi:hypothetical protein
MHADGGRESPEPSQVQHRGPVRRRRVECGGEDTREPSIATLGDELVARYAHERCAQ